MASHKVQFDLEWRDYIEAREVAVRVNGVPLKILIENFEAKSEMDFLEDAYGGLVQQYFPFGPLDDNFHGRSTTTMGPKTPLLGCVCGAWGCWPLMARVRVTDDLVTWDSFEQPRRPNDDYSAFGPFRFDRRQYDDALGRLSTALAADEAVRE
jgi:hypothetical protein